MLQRIVAPIIIITFFFAALFIYTRLAGPLPFQVNSVTTTKSDTYNVTGEGKVSVVPDIATVTLGISGNGSTVKGVQDQINSVINKVSDDVKNLGVKSEDIQTGGYNINPNYDYTLGSQKINGFAGSTSLTIKVRDLDKVNNVIDTATQNGANQVNGLTFDVADRTKAENQAREKAIQDAKSRAQQAAKVAGFQLGRLINYQENSSQATPIVPLRAAADQVKTQTEVQPGSTEITISVTLSYEIR